MSSIHSKGIYMCSLVFATVNIWTRYVTASSQPTLRQCRADMLRCHRSSLPPCLPPSLRPLCTPPFKPRSDRERASEPARPCCLVRGERPEILGVGCVEGKKKCLSSWTTSRRQSHRCPNPTPPRNPNPNPPHPSQPWHRQWIIKCPTCFINRPNQNDEPLEERAVC